jgi:hypothetical protein
MRAPEEDLDHLFQDELEQGRFTFAQRHPTRVPSGPADPSRRRV